MHAHRVRRRRTTAWERAVGADVRPPDMPAPPANYDEGQASISDGQESIKRLLDLTYRSQVETFQRLLTTEATLEQLQAELSPDELQQLQTIILDMEYLQYLPGTSTSSSMGVEVGQQDGMDSTAMRGRQPPAQQQQQRRDLQQARLAVQGLPPDLMRY